MSRVYIKFYDPVKISSRDFLEMNDKTVRRTIFSPDNKHSVALSPLRDGTLLFVNEGDIKFEWTITRNGRTLANFKYSAGKILINSNWKLNETGVENREIHYNPDIKYCDQLNFEISGDGLLRVDVKVNESGFAAATFSNRDLIFVRMNGNHAFPRLLGLIQGEKQKSKKEGIEAAFNTFMG